MALRNGPTVYQRGPKTNPHSRRASASNGPHFKWCAAVLNQGRTRIPIRHSGVGRSGGVVIRRHSGHHQSQRHGPNHCHEPASIRPAVLPRDFEVKSTGNDKLSRPLLSARLAVRLWWPSTNHIVTFHRTGPGIGWKPTFVNSSLNLGSLRYPSQ